jgi:hypothetical protein
MPPSDEDDDDEETHVFPAATIVAETAQAVKVVDQHGADFWCPKSVIHDDSEVWQKGGEAGKFIVHGWWARKNGFA